MNPIYVVALVAAALVLGVGLRLEFRRRGTDHTARTYLMVAGLGLLLALLIWRLVGPERPVWYGLAGGVAMAGALVASLAKWKGIAESGARRRGS